MLAYQQPFLTVSDVIWRRGVCVWGADGLSVMVPADEAAGRDGGVGNCQYFFGHKPPSSCVKNNFEILFEAHCQL